MYSRSAQFNEDFENRLGKENKLFISFHFIIDLVTQKKIAYTIRSMWKVIEI